VNYFANLRMEWIAETLRVFGSINRGHIERKFGISTPQASADLKQFADLNPGVMRYDTRKKRYVASPPPESGPTRAPGPQKALPPACAGDGA